MPSPARATVLTVEDDPIVRADLRLVLEDAGFEVCGDARDGVEAVQLARTLSPDVILLDLGLPRLDGVGATRQILAERDVPIVALTGWSRHLLRDAVRAGVASYVLKPFEQTEVVDALREAISAHQAPGAPARRDSPWPPVPARADSLRVLSQLARDVEPGGAWAAELERQARQARHAWRLQ